MKFWSKELLNAFTDLLHKCTHSLKVPAGLQNLFVEDNGIKVYFKGLVYGDIRPEYSHEETEAVYLVMYSKLMLELITDNADYNDYPNLAIDLNLKCILEECSKAYDRYKDRRDEENQEELKKSAKDKTVARKLDTEASRMKEFGKMPEKKSRLPIKKMSEPGYLNDHLTFMRLQVHPYFSSQEQEVDLALVMEEYERIFGANKQ
jgi:hypothetical protein